MKSIDFRVIDPQDSDGLGDWVQVWAETSHREPQAHPGYGLALTVPPDRMLGAVATQPSGSVILPFVVQDIPIGASSATRDAITPYGYGGAYLDGSVDSGSFWSRWDQWARANGVLGLTVRSHLFSDGILPLPGRCLSPLKNVVVDLSRSEEGIWSGYEGRARTDIRRGRELGVEISIDVDCERLEDFHRLYLDTMLARGADSFYLFPHSRLQELVAASPQSVVLSHAHADGRLVASEMQLLGSQNAYCFLSGNTEEGRRFRANPVMRHEVIKWLKRRGLSRYVLGGGLKDNDGLFLYKRAFAPSGIVDYNVIHHETQPGVVSALVAARMKEQSEWRPAEGFVPAYRAPAATDSITPVPGEAHAGRHDGR